MSRGSESNESGERGALLVASLRADGALLAALAALGWQPMTGPSAAMGAAHPVSAALLDLRAVDGEQEVPAGLRELVEQSEPALQWVALVPAAEDARAAVAELVSRCCGAVLAAPTALDRIDLLLRNAARMTGLRRAAAIHLPPAGGIVGTSAASQRLRRRIQDVAHSTAPLLITGECGSGKTLTALAVHAQSSNADGALIRVDCAALNGSLRARLQVLEPSVDPDAGRHAPGHAAATGSLLLEGIEHLPAAAQIELLGLLDTLPGPIAAPAVSLPGTPPVPRIIATATAPDAAIDQGRLRADLFYRLDVLRVAIPPLRERLQDCERLAWAVFHHHRRERSAGVRGFSEEALAAMQRHPWPGNIRELTNRVRRALLCCGTSLISAEDLGLESSDEPAPEPVPTSATQLVEARARAERDALRAMLRHTGGNASAAARRLGISRATLYRLLSKHGLSATQGRGTLPAPSQPSAPSMGRGSAMHGVAIAAGPAPGQW